MRARGLIPGSDAGVGTTLAEAVGGLAGLLLVSRVTGGWVSGAATSAAAGVLRGVSAVPGVAFLGQKKWAILLLAVVIDAVGCTSYLLPGIGEAEDAAWAPISAVLVQALYGSWTLTAIDFAKEALPFTDALPMATVGWFLNYTNAGKGLRDVSNTAGKISGAGDGKKGR